MFNNQLKISINILEKRIENLTNEINKLNVKIMLLEEKLGKDKPIQFKRRGRRKNNQDNNEKTE